MLCSACNYCRLLCVDVDNEAAVAELRRYLIRFGVIKAADVVLPCQELLRQIVMSAAVIQPVSQSESNCDIATDVSTDSSVPTDALQVQFLSLGHFATLLEHVL